MLLVSAILMAGWGTTLPLIPLSEFPKPAQLSSEDEAWNLLCGAAWKYMWVREPAKFSSEITEALYEVSQGISGIMLSVLTTAQLAAMEGHGAETVDADLIRKVYQERMTPLHSAIRILKSGDPKLMDEFDDLYRNAYPTIDRSEDDSRRRSTAYGRGKLGRS